MMRPRLEGVAIHEEWLEEGYQIRADGHQVLQVLYNILGNAGDALGASGEIWVSLVRADRLSVGSGLRSRESDRQGWVGLVIRDNGPGMSDEVRKKIFEPFYTTKANRKGTGLGLATSLRLIQGMGGAIDVSSKPGEGSVFTVWLPGEGSPAGWTAPSDASVSVPVRGEGSVLVVDDEATVREGLGEMLRHLGYTVCLAGCGEEALKLVASLLGQRPRLALVICTGSWVEGEPCPLGAEGENLVCIEKPVRMLRLSEVLEAVLLRKRKADGC